MPIPVSVTLKTASPPTASRPITICSPGFENFTALESRFSTRAPACRHRRRRAPAGRRRAARGRGRGRAGAAGSTREPAREAGGRRGAPGEPEGADLDLRHRQHVLDQAHQSTPVALDATDHLTLDGRQVGGVLAQQQLGVAQDARDRRAELVADRGEEVVLRLVELREPVHDELLRGQGLLHVALLTAALGDVLGHGEVAGRGATGGVPTAQRDRGGQQGAVGAAEAPVRDVGVVRGVQQRSDGGVQARRVGPLVVAERDTRSSSPDWARITVARPSSSRAR